MLVITDQKPTEEVLNKALAPFHEFECTGEDNEYVQNVDRTAEAREEFAGKERLRFRDPEGNLHDPYSDQFYRDPTPEEVKQIGPLGGTGFGGGISYTSKDWGDGRGYRTKIHQLPEGWAEVNVSAGTVETFAEFASGYYGGPIVRPEDGEPDPKANPELKYGWVRVDEAGEVLEVIDRTNPNKKWDWWVVGGRWSGFLTPKANAQGAAKGRPGLMGSEANPKGVDVIRKGDVDFEAMRAAARTRAAQSWDKVHGIIGAHVEGFQPWDKVREAHAGNIDAAREAYHDQPLRKALGEAAKTDKDLIWIDVEDYLVTREEYIQRASDRATVLFGVLKDGQWVERGEMGWFGCVSDEKDKDTWNRDFNAMLDALPDDTWLAVVDCHI
ncbi:hypothetical protein [Bordetella phage FP1]|uniref:Uncharacterized protein n=1 Tax=Bordetella phage FP1 TaxID=1916125 RepID=A0A2D0WBM9_9CAUD|nr:hypothetical protein HOS31_gp42 [Bordetella phage FP1]APL99341.1 hypothetical protein [Bordetella phage FP1]